ncbi:hypothetical protein ACJZ2D_005665 [Fusarium nematophilum]
MASFWRRTANALLSALALTGPALADVVLYNQANEFTTLAESSGGFPRQMFRSSDIIAPVLNINSFRSDGIDDAQYIFLGTVYGNMRAGPMILDARDFSLVYADQHYDNSYCSNVQTVNGTRYLVFWEGVHNRGHANGYGLVYDEGYNLVYNVTAQGLDGALADMHEVQLTPQGTMIFSVYWNVPYDCTAMGGEASCLLMDSGFQEVDAATNKVLFRWAASEYFTLADSHARYTEGFGVKEGSGFDFFHINSVEKTDDGNYLISSRHTSTLALIDGTNGQPIWILGGRRNQFRDLSGGRATNFGWQHDARFYKNQSHITMFDNHAEHTGRCDGPCKSRGLHLAINTTDMTVRVVQEYFHPSGIDSGAMGGMQTLENGNVIVGWGYTPSFVEYAPNGTVVMEAHRGKIGQGFQADMFAYRAHKGNWTGRPPWLPSAAVDAPHRTTENATVFLSWNGATDIASWAVLASPYANHVNGFDNIVALANKTGFETEIFLGNRSSCRYLGAAALNKDGDILGSTFVIDMATGQPALMPSNIRDIWPEPEPLMSGPSLLSAVALFGAVNAGPCDPTSTTATSTSETVAPTVVVDPCRPADQLKNGNFDTNAGQGWSTSGAALLSEGTARSAPIKAELTATLSSTSGVSQTIRGLKANQRYNLLFYYQSVQSPAAEDECYIVTKLGSQETNGFFRIGGVSVGYYAGRQDNFTPAVGGELELQMRLECVRLSAGADANGFKVYLDDVTLKEALPNECMG